MKDYKKQRLLKPKLCKEKIRVLKFNAEAREVYLDTLKRRRSIARKKKRAEEEEEKRERIREKRRNRQKRIDQEADIAERVSFAFGEKEETEKEIGGSIVTIREL